jgi:hypothetical protein
MRLSTATVARSTLSILRLRRHSDVTYNRVGIATRCHSDLLQMLQASIITERRKCFASGRDTLEGKEII